METTAFTRKNTDPKTKDISQKRRNEKVILVKATLSPWDRMVRPIVPRGGGLQKGDHTTGTHFGRTGN